LQEPPKRSVVFVAVALSVMSGCVFVAGQTAAMLASDNSWDRLIGGVVLVFPVVLGVAQYFALFRQSEPATRVTAGVLLFLCAAYGVMGLFAALAPNVQWLRRVAPLTIAGFMGWAAWKNYQWRFALRAYYRLSPKPADRWQISLTEILGATLAAALAAAIASYQVSNLPKP
jgi:hypothetical protein